MSSDLVSNFRVTIECYLCGDKELQIFSDEYKNTMMQCISCGFSTSTSLEGDMNKNKHFKSLDENIKSWSVESNGFIWTPSIVNLQTGTIYPVEDSGSMKWAFAQLVDINLDDIPESEKEEYKKEDGSFFNKKLDIKNQIILDNFNETVLVAEKLFKENARK